MSEHKSAFDLLEGDVNGQGLRTLKDELLELKNAVKKKMDAGLDTATFAIAKRVLTAVETAEETIVNVHNKLVG